MEYGVLRIPKNCDFNGGGSTRFQRAKRIRGGAVTVKGEMRTLDDQVASDQKGSQAAIGRPRVNFIA